MFCSLTGSCLPIYHMVAFSALIVSKKCLLRTSCHESWPFVWTQSLTDTADHVKNYRPKLIVLTGNPATRFHHYFECLIYCNHMFSIVISLFAFWGLFITCYQYNQWVPKSTCHLALRPPLVDFANLITKKLSLLICGHVISVRSSTNYLKLRRNPELSKRFLKWSQNLGFSQVSPTGSRSWIVWGGGLWGPDLQFPDGPIPFSPQSRRLFSRAALKFLNSG